MSSAPFTPEQEARLREIVREEVELDRIATGRMADALFIARFGSPENDPAFADRADDIFRRISDGGDVLVHTPLSGGRPRKFKTVREPTLPSDPQGTR